MVLGSALKPVAVDNPIDVAFTDSYMLVLRENAGKYEVLVIEPESNNIVSTFGSLVASSAGGEFTDPVAVYSNGYDLFVAESAQIHVIRSGVGDWFSGAGLAN